jgi:hypothetical protein
MPSPVILAATHSRNALSCRSWCVRCDEMILLMGDSVIAGSSVLHAALITSLTSVWSEHGLEAVRAGVRQLATQRGDSARPAARKPAVLYRLRLDVGRPTGTHNWVFG